MIDLLKKKSELVNIKQLNELMSKFNKKEELEQKKTNTWLIVGLIALSVLVAGLVVYKLFFAGDEFDEFDEFDDEFDDMDYDDDYEDFDDYEEDDSFEEESFDEE